MAKVTVKLNRQTIREILRSDRVLADLTRRAAAVAAASSTGDLTYEVRSDVGRARARAAVIAAGARTNAHELAHHDLARTIDHARR
jgi:broad specificity phosphatase PhoE